ncbi:hypothetical protein HDU76_004189, partial [Blyttiomyces sp. JEL0837]
SEYNTPTQKIGTGTFGGSYTETGTIKSSLDDVNDIQPYLKGLITKGVIKPNANTYYAMHFGPGISITQGGSSSCVQFCAYHGTIDISSFNLGTKYLYYGIMPDQGGSCAGGCGSSSNTFNNLCSVSSHELVEAITDAAVGLATGNASPLAWYDQTNGEIGDICNAQQGTVVGGDGVTYTVQAQWSNSQNACIVSKAGVHPTSTPTTTKATSTTAKTTTTANPTTTPVSSCAHSVCVSGVALTSSCDSCAAAVIAKDSYCGSTSWDSQCVSEVATYCPSVNCNAPTTTAATSTKTSTTVKPTTTAVTCAHPICSTGVKLTSSCDPCAAQIIAQDSYCGSTQWDSQCVSEVGSICGITC